MKYSVCQIEVRELDIAHNSSKIKEYIMRSKSNNVEMACFCEGALTGWVTDKYEKIKELIVEIQTSIRDISILCNEEGINAIVGAIIPLHEKVVNCAIFFSKNGQYWLIKDKYFSIFGVNDFSILFSTRTSFNFLDPFWNFTVVVVLQFFRVKLIEGLVGI